MSDQERKDIILNGKSSGYDVRTKVLGETKQNDRDIINNHMNFVRSEQSKQKFKQNQTKAVDQSNVQRKIYYATKPFNPDEIIVSLNPLLEKDAESRVMNDKTVSLCR